MPKLAVIITAYNRADFVATCLASLLDAASDDLHIIPIVMDNGSSDGTADAARAAGEVVRVIRTEDNRNIANVINRGLRAALEDPLVDHLIVMNEDTQWQSGSVQLLMQACSVHPQGLLTPLVLNYRAPEKLDNSWLELVKQVRELVEDAVLGRPLQQVYPLPTIAIAAALARREVWENVGFFDELFWFYGVDDDYCTRAKWLGHPLLLVPESHLLHAHGKLAENVPGTWSNPIIKWRKELQARYMFRLKRPDRGFLLAYLETFWYALETSLQSVRALWPRGAIEAQTIFLRCLFIAPSIARTRRQHFDTSRRLRNSQE